MGQTCLNGTAAGKIILAAASPRPQLRLRARAAWADGRGGALWHTHLLKGVGLEGLEAEDVEDADEASPLVGGAGEAVDLGDEEVEEGRREAPLRHRRLPRERDVEDELGDGGPGGDLLLRPLLDRVPDLGSFCCWT